MCSACGFPAKPGHWTDAGASSPAERLRLRFIRLASVNRLLAPWGLKAHDDGATPGLQLFAPGGARVLVDDLESLWLEAARMAGEPIDPLSARALDHEG
ncbi:hypothetical protein E4191_03535 [Paracoccus liaowanqingii]|uniref:Uncharacterized protein n=1 Tax=Paracoccus liaowanqingii TaxID=2560053 RepID=A0A4P7HLA3_9RHOB|nr:hypothetical protein [Paracoccus liaowanqingii]QBX33891.1 hypothetical protein E4191_03535 [Paracoccus liaowanqingii]